jgi:hypothetical protein
MKISLRDIHLLFWIPFIRTFCIQLRNSVKQHYHSTCLWERDLVSRFSISLLFQVLQFLEISQRKE